MRRLALAAALALGVIGTTPFLVDPSIPGGFRYDGHGGLSAGASSRLLFDYEEPMRTQILDYLFEPKFGASLHQVKVEIGGDSQSTDGTEASHQHARNDLDCHRGYEWWLLSEARKRNPKVVTHALSWAVPRWVGDDTYFSDDNIDYHISWLKCAREEHPDIGPIDYVGIWNERAWGTTDWIKKFRAAMDEGGFSETKIFLPDGGFNVTILENIDADPEFGRAIEGGGIGLHYPCDEPHPEVQNKYGLKYWSSEDYSTEANWDGAGCWGRILNQNFVRMNMTSTISWSLIWSVYDDWPYYGSGLMYAFSPWSGHYTVNEAIWTSAQHCQFTEPGWFYVAGQGSGSLANGGSYVSLVDPSARDVTIVIEKLHGECLRCGGQITQAETVRLQLADTLLDHASLSVWSTNETHHFVRLADAVVDASSGIVNVDVGPDSIVTLSSTSGQKKGSFPSIPDDEPFPLPYADDFETREPPQFPKFFTDNGGSFELIADLLQSHNQVLTQVVSAPPENNSWVRDVNPITVLGDKSWGPNLWFTADVLLPEEDPPIEKYHAMANKASGLCLDILGNGSDEVALVVTESCKAVHHQHFFLDRHLLHISDASGPSNMCLSAGPCPAGVALCQSTCDPGSSSQTWTEPDEGTLSVNGLCLQSQSSIGGQAAALRACKAGSKSQEWSLHTDYVGMCVRVGGGGQNQQHWSRGNCLNIKRSGAWRLTEDGDLLATGQLSVGNGIVGSWHSLALEARGSELTAFFDGARVGGATSSLRRTGRVGLASGWNRAYFDNFSVDRATADSPAHLEAVASSEPSLGASSFLLTV